MNMLQFLLSILLYTHMLSSQVKASVLKWTPTPSNAPSMYSKGRQQPSMPLVDSQERWIQRAVDSMKQINCANVQSLPEQLCNQIKYHEKAKIAVYVPDSKDHRMRFQLKSFKLKPRLYRRFPLGIRSNQQQRFHRFVFIVDLLSEYSFGHVVFPFYVDRIINSTRTRSPREANLDGETCVGIGGSIIGQYCVYALVKKGCQNPFEPELQSQNMEYVEFVKYNRPRCEFQMLPQIHGISQSLSIGFDNMRKRSLYRRSMHQFYSQWSRPSSQPSLINWRCLSSKQLGLANCQGRGKQNFQEDLSEESVVPAVPKRRESNWSSMRVMSQAFDKLTTVDNNYLHVSCTERPIQDQAILLSGRWSKSHLGQSTHDAVVNARQIRQRLLGAGFHSSNIVSFVTNGQLPHRKSNTGFGTWQPASGGYAKQLWKQRVYEICSNPNCADIFFIYLNTYVLPDGSMLLWDIDNDGEAGANEYLTTEELMQGLMNCRVNKVIIVADQNYPAHIYDYLNDPSYLNAFDNVMLISGVSTSRYPFEEKFYVETSKLTKTIYKAKQFKRSDLYEFDQWVNLVNSSGVQTHNARRERREEKAKSRVQRSEPSSWLFYRRLKEKSQMNSRTNYSPIGCQNPIQKYRNKNDPLWYQRND